MKRKLDFLIGVPLVKALSLFTKKDIASPSPLRKILIIKLAAFGDAVLLIPVLRSLRMANPNAEIHWLVSPINESIAMTVPYVDKIHTLESFSLGSVLQIVQTLKDEKFDAVLDFEQWARGTAIVSALTKAPVRIGFDTPGQHRSSLYTKTVVKRSQDHEIYEFFNLAESLQPIIRDSRLELWETDMGKGEVYIHLVDLDKNRNKTKYVLIHPGCGADGKPREWPLSDYALLAHWILKNYPGTKIIITGGPEEAKKTFDLWKLLKGKAKNLGGKLSWAGTISLVKNMDFVISGNTGIMHIAAAFSKKQIALHGPTDPDLWGPLNDNAIVIQSKCSQCPSLKLGFEYHSLTQDCMKKIEYPVVKEAFQQLVDKGISST